MKKSPRFVCKNNLEAKTPHESPRNSFWPMVQTSRKFPGVKSPLLHLQNSQQLALVGSLKAQRNTSKDTGFNCRIHLEVLLSTCGSAVDIGDFVILYDAKVELLNRLWDESSISQR